MANCLERTSQIHDFHLSPRDLSVQMDGHSLTVKVTSAEARLISFPAYLRRRLYSSLLLVVVVVVVVSLRCEIDSRNFLVNWTASPRSIEE